MIKPSLYIKDKGTGASKPVRYLYGGTGGVVQFLYDDHILYDDPAILYDGSFSAVVRIAYGDHVLYGGTGETFVQVETRPNIEMYKPKTQMRIQVSNKPNITIL